MSDKRLPNSNSQVKRKRRTISAGAAITRADVARLPSRQQGPKSNPLMYVKPEWCAWIKKCPHLNPTDKLVACFLSDYFRIEDGFARPPLSRIAKELGLVSKSGKPAIRSVSRSVKTLYDRGYMSVQSGGPTRSQGRGTVASRYVPYYWGVINCDTWEIMKNADYEISTRKPIAGAGDYGAPDHRGAYGAPDHRVDTRKPIAGAGDYGAPDQGYLSTSGAQEAAPTATPDGSANGSAPRPKDQVKPLPPDNEKMKMKSDLFFGLAEHCSQRGVLSEMDLDRLREIIEGNGDVEFLRSWCESEEMYNEPPPDEFLFAHVIFHGDRTPMTCEEGNCGHIKLADIKPTDWVAVECRNMPN